MLPLSKTKQRVFLSLFLVLLALGAYGFVFLLLSQKANRVSVLAVETNSVTERQKAVDNARILLGETEVERSILSSSFVEESSPVGFISEVEGLGSISGTLLEINSVDTETINNIEHLKVSLSSIGSWENVYHLLALIEALPYHAVISSFSVERHSEEEGSGAWKIMIDFVVPLISRT
jgi:hypothetical protein